MEPPEQMPRRLRRIALAGLLAYIFLRWIFLALPGYPDDILAYKRWAMHGAMTGISQIYRTSDIDYPPVYAYILTPLAQFYRLVSPDNFREGRDSTLLTVLIKLPPLIFDLAIAGLAFWWLRRRRRLRAPGAPAHTGEAAGWSPWWLIVPAAYLLNPATLFNCAWWGEPDAVHTFFVLAAFLSVADLTHRKAPGRKPASGGIGQAWPAWVLLTLATLMKPLGAPFFPLLLLLSLLLHGLGATAVGMAFSLVTAGLVFSPFLATGQGAEVFRRVLGDVGAMAYTSSNAHNLWWLLGSWKPAEQPWLGPVTPTQFGLALFGLVYLGLLLKAYRLHRAQPAGLAPAQVLALALGVGFAFFMLSTHMHENHMFVVLPLGLLLLPQGRFWRGFFIAASAGVFFNLLLHDLTIPLHWPFTIGGETRFINPHLHQPFHLLELICIWGSDLFNLGLFALFLGRLFRRGKPGLLEQLAD
jgi:hypothetical protein